MTQKTAWTSQNNGAQAVGFFTTCSPVVTHESASRTLLAL